MKRLSLISILLIFSILSACDEESPILECPTELLCTEEFRFFTFAPLDSQDQPIILDSHYSQNLDNAQTYTFTNEDSPLAEGNYLVVTDAQLEELNATGTTLRFIGIKEGEIVIEHDFVIGHDCCHIVPLEGPGTE